VCAVNDLTAEIPDGEIFGLLGPNGAGKSTTILMLVGLIQPTSGRCLVDGIDVAKDPIAVKQRIGYMPEDVGFYPNLNAEENLTYFAKLYRMEPDVRRKRIDDLLSLVCLGGVTKDVGGYSKGMRQRLGLAKALLADPSIIILDEPTANLDPQGVLDYRRIILSVASEGKTVVVSSHILAEVSRVSTSVGILSAGKLIAKGSWKELAEDLVQRSAGLVTIRVETADPMPELEDPSIVSITYSSLRTEATVVARSDIRGAIADQLAGSGIRLRGLSRETVSPEETFLSYYSVVS
jgi:ABC-2 type transport system ATP-binding protein